MARLVAAETPRGLGTFRSGARWALPLMLALLLLVLLVRLADPLAGRRLLLLLSTWWINLRWTWAADVVPGLQTVATLFLGLFIEVLPFLLLGVLVSAGLEEF